MNTSRVLTSVAEHLGGFELNEPVQVTVRALRGGPSGTVQLAGGSLPELAAELLAWADTLDNVTATVWRPHWPDDEQLHLEIRGELTDNTQVKVFGGLFNGPDVPGLGYGCRIELSWAWLRAWASLGEEVAA
ncbi:hypothetical protein LWC34_36455 [Kibdelosporangium philippinense]|uniref:Uncharacterized protein n=1 Tax=Kibdelosporangium philippinense TaxID=211113 RepID=A0ABS8ZP57_9PSEU|nr:hypothetical protein [Kibdelosporangium philippinense]MCE7008268.1 hypothetical protein [Kibdelosporangium philippinense]